MAIKFVDVEPQGEGKQKWAKKADVPPVVRETDAETLKESVEPELPFTKPAQKKRGRK